MKTKILGMITATTKKERKFLLTLVLLGLVLLLFLIEWSKPLHNIEENHTGQISPSQNLGSIAEPTWEEIARVGIKEGWTEKEMNYINNYCSTQNNPKRCSMLAIAIADAETGTCQRGVGRKHKNNCFSMTDGHREKTYIKRIASFEDWVESYNEYWYNNSCSDMVYRSNYVGQGAKYEQRENWINNCELTIVKFYN